MYRSHLVMLFNSRIKVLSLNASDSFLACHRMMSIHDEHIAFARANCTVGIKLKVGLGRAQLPFRFNVLLLIWVEHHCVDHFNVKLFLWHLRGPRPKVFRCQPQSLSYYGDFTFLIECMFFVHFWLSIEFNILYFLRLNLLHSVFEEETALPANLIRATRLGCGSQQMFPMQAARVKNPVQLQTR